MRVVVVPSLVEAQDEFKPISQEEAAAGGEGGEGHSIPAAAAAY
jgi:hypothetical protein